MAEAGFFSNSFTPHYGESIEEKQTKTWFACIAVEDFFLSGENVVTGTKENSLREFLAVRPYQR